MADATQATGGARFITLSRLFWIVASLDILVFAAIAADTYTNPSGEFAGLAAAMFAGLAVITVVLMGVVALIRRPVAYGVGLALVLWPSIYYCGTYLLEYLSTPSEQSRDAGHGYFAGAADRDLADAIMAGDTRKVAALAPSANLDAVGWDGMTFMRLAVINAHAKPDVVVALLKAGINPDQDYQMLLGSIHDGEEADSGTMITQKNENLLHAVVDTKIDLNKWDPQGEPRFFSAIRWPEGLAYMLDHGANANAPSKDGYSAMMWAIVFENWAAIEVLLDHGAQLDHRAPDGKTPRSMLLGKIDDIQKAHEKEPAGLAALEPRLH